MIGVDLVVISRIKHRLQTGKVVIGTLQGSSAGGTAFSVGSCIEQNLMAQMDSVAVSTQIVDVSEFISGMINRRSITVCLIRQQVERQGDILRSRNRIGRKLDKIFMKAEIAIIGQKAGDTPALISNVSTVNLIPGLIC